MIDMDLIEMDIENRAVYLEFLDDINNAIDEVFKDGEKDIYEWIHNYFKEVNFHYSIPCLSGIELTLTKRRGRFTCMQTHQVGAPLSFSYHIGDKTSTIYPEGENREAIMNFIDLYFLQG